MSDPVLFMTHISYNGGVRASARQFDTAFMRVEDLKARGMKVARMQSGSSLLAKSFNEAWCTALNMRESGINVVYFFMLHDDVVPEDWFVSTLLEDLESSGADMVSAVVPLKDTTGNTSTAIASSFALPFGHSLDERFSIERRITLHEAQKNLPPVFSAAECGYPDRALLANTGCWLCRLDRPWVDAVDKHGDKVAYFTITDRIRRNPNTGRWVTVTEPEDWFFSRQLHSLGAKVCCTTNVKLCHWGITPYPNYPNAEGETYGDLPYDYAFGEKVGYTEIGKEKPKYNMTYESTELGDVIGWLNDDEGRLLAEMAKGRKVLEIGSYCGRSTIWMARKAESLLAVDTWDGRGTPNPRDTLPIFDANIESFGLTQKVSRAGGTIQAVKKANGWNKGSDWYNPEGIPFGMVFIDGAHDEVSVRTDVEESLPLLATDGLLAFHDYGRPTEPGVTRVVDELISKGAEIVSRAGSVIVLKVNHGRPSGIGSSEERLNGGFEANGDGAGQEHRDSEPSTEGCHIVASDAQVSFSATITA